MALRLIFLNRRLDNLLSRLCWCFWCKLDYLLPMPSFETGIVILITLSFSKMSAKHVILLEVVYRYYKWYFLLADDLITEKVLENYVPPLSRRIRSKYISKRNLYCKICGYKPNMNPKLDFRVLCNHIVIHTRVPVDKRKPFECYVSQNTCRLCGFYTNRMEGLHEHVLIHFLKVKNHFTCNLCFATFDKKSGLRQHQLVHRRNDSDTESDE